MKSETHISPVLLNIMQTCRYLNISRNTYYRISASGKLGVMPVKICSKTLYSREELEKWVQSGCPSRRDWSNLTQYKIKN